MYLLTDQNYRKRRISGSLLLEVAKRFKCTHKSINEILTSDICIYIYLFYILQAILWDSSYQCLYTTGMYVVKYVIIFQ